jgi:hypothetical protein
MVEWCASVPREELTRSERQLLPGPRLAQRPEHTSVAMDPAVVLRPVVFQSAA